ncbi:MAG: MarR family transcriptional regulator [Sphingomonas bacterium]|nr:MarR family transcriptional regulator [Sphingomonas bacterium]
MNAKATEHARRVIDRHLFVPHYLAVLANAMISSQSRFYLENYGAGINEVRLITVIAHTPNQTAKELSSMLVMNKSIASRSLSELRMKCLVRDEVVGRSRTFTLTEMGYDLNEKIVHISMERERRLLAGFTPNDKAILIGYLARMFDNLASTVDLEQMVADDRSGNSSEA